jgi:O-antigen/teichoic acid export membrane protein
MASSKITNNAFANLSGMSIQMAIAFVLSPFLVHSLGDERYGIWTIAVAFTGYMNLMDLGLTSAVSRYVSKYHGLNDTEKVNKIISTAFYLFILMGTIIVLLSPLMADIVVSLVQLDPSLINVVHMLIIIVSFDIAIFVVSGLFKGLFSGAQQFWVINYIQVISSIYKAILFYLLLSEGFGLVAMGLVSITANLLTIVIFYLAFKKRFPNYVISFKLLNRHSSSEILNYSKFTFLAMLANQIIFYSDSFVIGYFLGAAAVTYYAIPWTLADYSKKISLVISQTFTPAISESEAQDNLDHVRHLYVLGTKYMVIISNLLSVGVFILGGAFIAIWMGPKYRELCETVLIILFINQFVMGPQQISYSVLLGLGKQKMFSYMSIAVSVVNLVLSIILVQSYGIEGVALGAVIPQVIFYGLYVPQLALNALNMSKWQYFKETYLPNLLPTLMLFGALFYLDDFFDPESFIVLLSCAAFGTLIYLAASFLLSLSGEERTNVLSIIKRPVGLNQ